MAQEYEQFYRTWCLSGRSVSGAHGWNIRAKSDGLALQEAEGLADLANYWSTTSVNPSKPPGRRLALFRLPDGAVVAHGILTRGLVGGRAGVSFEHVVTGLPRKVSALEVIKLWRSPVWCLEDGDFGSKLRTFGWGSDAYGPDFVGGHGRAEGGELEDRDWEIAVGFIGQTGMQGWALDVLRACLAVANGTVEKFHLAGRDDTIARLLFIAFFCLPERLRREVTFSTHENPKSSKGVQVVGVTTFEGEESDFAAYCYGGNYRALNTFNETKSEDPTASCFAESAVRWLSEGYYGWLTDVRRCFDALDPADNPTVSDLDLLAAWAPTAGDALVEAKMLLKLCGSPAIGHSKVRDRQGLSVLVKYARESDELREGVASQLAGWLPKHSVASQEFIAELAQIAFGWLQEGQTFERLEWYADFAGQVGQDLKGRYWKELLLLCQARLGSGVSAEAPLPALETRLSLLGEWRQRRLLPEVRHEDSGGYVVSCWLQVGPDELVAVLRSALQDDLRRKAVELLLRSKNQEDVPGVIKIARDNSEFSTHLVKQLTAISAERNQTLEGLSEALVSVACEDLRLGKRAGDIDRLAMFAAQIVPALDNKFWETLLTACQQAADRAGSMRALVPSLEMRVWLLQAWEGLATPGDHTRLDKVSELWLQGLSTQDLVQVLKSSLSYGLKEEGVRLWLTSGAIAEGQATDDIFDLICRDGEMIQRLFLGLPTWRVWDGGRLWMVQDACWSRLLDHQDKQMRLVDSLDDVVVERLGCWNERVPNLMPPQMRARFSLGQYLKAPSYDCQLVKPLLESKFWSQQEDKGEAVNGALLDRVLERATVDDYRHFLKLFGEGLWAESALELIRNSHHRITSAQPSLACQDPALKDVISSLELVRSECEDTESARALANAPPPLPLRGSEHAIQSVCQIARLYFPSSSLIKTPTGQSLIDWLVENSGYLDDSGRMWAEHLQVLYSAWAEIRKAIKPAPERIGKLIQDLALAYRSLNRTTDTDVYEWVNTMLLSWVRDQPEKVPSILSHFIERVYCVDQNLFMQCFIKRFCDGLVVLAKREDNARLWLELIRFFFDPKNQPKAERFYREQSVELIDWGRALLRELPPKSRKQIVREAERVGGNCLIIVRRAMGIPLLMSRSRGGGKSRRIRWGFYCLAILIGLAWLGWHQREPRYAKKPLSMWLKEIEQSKGEQQTTRSNDARTAVQTLGEKALPSLVSMAQAKDSVTRRTVRGWLGRLPLVQLPPTTSAEYHEMAKNGFAILGSEASPAAPELVKSLSDEDGEVKSCADFCLRKIWPDATDTESLLRRLAEGKDSKLKKAAIKALDKIERDKTAEKRSEQ